MEHGRGWSLSSHVVLCPSNLCHLPLMAGPGVPMWDGQGKVHFPDSDRVEPRDL
jgi:hypothetical protein